MADFTSQGDRYSCMKRDFPRMNQEHHQVKFEFIIAELDLAITFCNIADSAGSGVKSERNLGHAARAFETAVRCAQNADLTLEMRQQINERIDRLNPRLHDLVGGLSARS
jgi:hypothetical protein